MAKKMVGVVSIAGIALFGWGSTISTSVCSCIPAASAFAHKMGAHPMTDSPEKIRSAFLSYVPLGATEDDLRESLQRLNHSFHRCQRDPDLVCRFEASQNFWGSKGYEMWARFDSKGKLEDIQFSKYET